MPSAISQAPRRYFTAYFRLVSASSSPCARAPIAHAARGLVADLHQAPIDAIAGARVEVALALDDAAHQRLRHLVERGVFRDQPVDVAARRVGRRPDDVAGRLLRHPRIGPLGEDVERRRAVRAAAAATRRVARWLRSASAQHRSSAAQPPRRAARCRIRWMPEISLVKRPGSDNGDIAAWSSRVVEHPASIPAPSTSPIRRPFFDAGKSRAPVCLRDPARKRPYTSPSSRAIGWAIGEGAQVSGGGGWPEMPYCS